MKPIELTSQHRYKLLEMCSTLFVEYSSIGLHGSHIYINDINGFHWFEFCMTTLLTELSKAYTPHGANSDEGMYLFKEVSIITILLHDEHPIDYLYEQFKQLK